MKAVSGRSAREHRVCNSLQWILVVVEARSAECEVEIDNDGIQREIMRDGPGHVVRDGGCADAALCADDGDDAANSDRLRCREQTADRAHHIEGFNRPDHVIADAATHQFAIGRDIIFIADHDDAGSGVAYGCELIKASQDIVAAFGLEDDYVRSGHAAVGFDGGFHAAHLDREMGLGEAPIQAGRLYRLGGLRRFAEGLHRHARGRSDVIVRRRRRGIRLIFGIVTQVVDHLPESLSLAFSDSG